jgi:hypothetical protein
MATWAEFTAEDPDLANRVGALFTGYRHHTMASLRRDGSPRISGTEVKLDEGEFVLGMMAGTRRAADLRRDPRIAVHSHSVDPPAEDEGSWSGEAKLAGRAVEVPREDDESGGAEWFRIDIDEVVLTRIGDPADRLVIERRSPDKGHRSTRR